ncbi:MAG TPA: alpha/beta hydrolase [Thermoanaerobaculia bacterium]|nr:alpha/beta hydrolase [Thermoanaerobaculia bacterium]
MAPRRIAFLGGNGHCAARLAEARRHLPPGVALLDVPYPGFEGRPRSGDFAAFLDAVGAHLGEAAPDLVYAMGIGGLLALCLRARGELLEIPLLFQAPILWGLEKRLMPKVMRLGLARFALTRLFATRSFQRRFVAKYFTHPPAPETVAAFFDGYTRCSAASDLFAWLDPALLRALEGDLEPAALNGIGIWWGGKDRVVTLQELAWTRDALGLGRRWPERVFPEWGHYPMIDDPENWAEELVRALAAPGSV